MFNTICARLHPMEFRVIGTAKVAETKITDQEWAQVETAHERFKLLLETKPRAKARYDATLAEIQR